MPLPAKQESAGQGRSATPRARVASGHDGPACRPRRGRLIAAFALSGGLAACGFRLRGTQQLPFDSVFIAAPPTSTVGPELARGIRNGTSTVVADDRAAAAAVIEILGESRERDVAAVDAQGRAREYRLRLRTSLRVVDRKGRELLGPTTVTVTRDLFAREEQLLAREYEEAQLYQDMLIDIGQQVLRRLSALKP
jgi:LPS-assembly lipoprotein